MATSCRRARCRGKPACNDTRAHHTHPLYLQLTTMTEERRRKQDEQQPSCMGTDPLRKAPLAHVPGFDCVPNPHQSRLIHKRKRTKNSFFRRDVAPSSKNPRADPFKSHPAPAANVTPVPPTNVDDTAAMLPRELREIPSLARTPKCRQCGLKGARTTKPNQKVPSPSAAVLKNRRSREKRAVFATQNDLPRVTAACGIPVLEL